MKRIILIAGLLTLMFSIVGCGGESKKTLTDREILMLVFNELNGENWSEKAKENWTSEEPLDKWNGVKIDDNGRVNSLLISNDSVRGIVPAEIGQLSELKSLYIRRGSKDMCENPFPASIGDLINLESLSLSANIERGKKIVFPPVGKLINLNTISLSGYGKAPEGIGQLSKLKDLELNGMTGELPASISKLTSIERIFIRGYDFTGALPSDIGNLKNLTFLLVDKSQFIGGVEVSIGELPESLWDMTKLKTIFLRGIADRGTLSPKIANLKNATGIEIIDCGLTGEIPKELYSLTQLKSFEVYDNKLTGTISPEIGNMVALETFWINNNQLTGTLPASMGKLSKLKTIQVQKNQLTGTIPAELANCPLDGVFVDFSENQFSANIAPALKAHPKFDKWKFDKK